ncbi:uncharacterized protein LOC124147372 [Haliotis rufescens]|uniref:uncharacterized protein LOC124147372 n=1 Tax=Haliotis rufescens TaxID=6454 RepID=UPI00201EA338|nr:uncharacterized protein LOC124147372 [Haliotis rufescens]
MIDDYILVLVLLIPPMASLNVTGKGQGQECRQTSECVSHAECWVNVCQCNIKYYPWKGQCEQRHRPSMPCSSDMECVDGAICRTNYCQCDDTHYHANTYNKRCMALSQLFPRNIRTEKTTSTTATVAWDAPELQPVSSTLKYYVSYNGKKRVFIKSLEVLNLTDLTPGTAFNVTVSVAVDEYNIIKIAPSKTATMRTLPSVPSNLRHDAELAFLLVYWSVQGHADSFNGSLWSRSSTERFTTPYTSYMFLRPNTTSRQILCVTARSGDLYSQMACYTFHMTLSNGMGNTTQSRSSVPTWSLILAVLLTCSITSAALLIGFRFRKRQCRCVTGKGENVYDMILFPRSSVRGGSSCDGDFEGAATYVNHSAVTDAARTEGIVFENDTETDDSVGCVYDQPRCI